MKAKDLTAKQKLILVANAKRNDNYFIKSTIEERQQKIFKCKKCGKKFDFSESVEYGSAVDMWNQRDGMCVMCYKNETGILLY